jgi:opacity protein-like surface antigen
MKTKVLLSLSAAALVNAAQLSAAPKISSGAYAGVAAGISVLGGKYNYKHDQDNVQQNNMAFSLSKTSAAASVFAGYGMKISGFWTAAEIFYQFDSLKNKQTPYIANDGKAISSKSTGAYGAAIHLGFLPAENCVAYAILGMEARKFNVKFDDIPPVQMNVKINKSYTSIAFAPGVGARFALTKNLSIRTEYKYAMHRSKKLTDTAGNGFGQIDRITVKHQPKVHAFNVGVVYNF